MYIVKLMNHRDGRTALLTLDVSIIFQSIHSWWGFPIYFTHAIVSENDLILIAPIYQLIFTNHHSFFSKFSLKSKFLQLLDQLVKNCGYYFHIQISTKEFLNTLVRRFPERPSLTFNPVIDRILELIHVWSLTICKNSKFKNDFKNILDMHRLLQSKGKNRFFQPSMP